MIYWEYYSLTVIDYELTHQQAPTNQCSVSRSQELQVRFNHNQTIRNKLLNYKNTIKQFSGLCIFFRSEYLSLFSPPFRQFYFLFFFDRSFSLTKKWKGLLLVRLVSVSVPLLAHCRPNAGCLYGQSSWSLLLLVYFLYHHIILSYLNSGCLYGQSVSHHKSLLTPCKGAL